MIFDLFYLNSLGKFCGRHKAVIRSIQGVYSAEMKCMNEEFDKARQMALALITKVNTLGKYLKTNYANKITNFDLEWINSFFIK